MVQPGRQQTLYACTFLTIFLEKKPSQIRDQVPKLFYTAKIHTFEKAEPVFCLTKRFIISVLKNPIL